MRAVRDDPSDPSKVRCREVARQQTTELDRARRLDLQSPGIRLAGRHSKILAPAHQQTPGCRILAIHFWETAFPHRKNRSPAFRQRDNCRCQKISAITTRRHLQTKAFERSRTESRMQSKCDMRGQRILGGRKTFIIRYFNEALSRRPSIPQSATFDFATPVRALTIFEPMQILTHDSGMVCPSSRWRGQIVVPVKKANPFASFIYPCETD